MIETLALLAVGLVAGAMNAMAGGGSFVTFPALVYAGLPPVVANASSTVALLPGGLSSIWAFRPDIGRRFAGVSMAWLAVVSAVGGLFGAVLLLDTPAHVFDLVIPFILLAATLTFAFGRRLGERAAGRAIAGPRAILAAQFVLGLYGGYFGGAVGIMMMAAWTAMTTIDAKTMNPHRSALVNAANSTAVVCFVATGAVNWRASLPVLAGAIVGGYGGALLARRLPREAVRGVVIAVSALVTAGFFVRLL